MLSYNWASLQKEESCLSPLEHTKPETSFTETAVFAIPTDLGISYNITFTEMQIKGGSQSHLVW